MTTTRRSVMLASGSSAADSVARHRRPARDLGGGQGAANHLVSNPSRPGQGAANQIVLEPSRPGQGAANHLVSNPSGPAQGTANHLQSAWGRRQRGQASSSNPGTQPGWRRVLISVVLLACCPCVLAARAQQSVAQSGRASVAKDDKATEQAARAKRERLLEIYAGEGAGYTIYRDDTHKDKVEFRREPIFVWTNPLRSHGQDGAVYVWTCQGRAEIVSSFFSFPATGPRSMAHEFHSLSLSVLDVERTGGRVSDWKPRAPGIDLAPIPGAPAPGRSAPQRLVQMRTLTHDFSASTKDHDERDWELRLLPQPFYRYLSTDPDVLDGAVFGFVTSAGTDLEALLVIEARKTASSAEPTWHYAMARFTDLELWGRHKGKQVFHETSIQYGADVQDPQDRYRVWTDKRIPAVEETAP
jgi:hypothetical protein